MTGQKVNRLIEKKMMEINKLKMKMKENIKI